MLTSIHINQSSTTCALSAQPRGSIVLLATALINVKNVIGSWMTCRALLDIASQTNLITQKTASNLGLPTRPNNINIRCVDAIQSRANREITIIISSRTNKFQRTLDCLLVPRLTDQLLQIDVNIHSGGLPTNLPLVDPHFRVSGDIDILLGAKFFIDLLLDGRWKLSRGLPTLQNSVFGWFESGRVEQTYSAKNKNSICLLSITNKNQDPQKMLSRIWTVEEVTLPETAWSQEECDCEQSFGATTKRNSNGRFFVNLLIKKDNYLGSSYEMAKNRFLVLERKLARDSVLKKKYISFMCEYQEFHHLEKVSKKNLEEKESYYLPYHVDQHPDKPDKLRVVFEASAKTTNGISLNDILCSGPTIQEDLLSIILRFRTRKLFLCC